MFYRYQNIQKQKSNQTGSVYYVNNIYPDIPVTADDHYVITVLGDRLDLLAYDFYQDSNLYWIISSANNLPGDSLVPPIGMQLRIPANIQSVINNYQSINRVR
jgi:hypothetical protein